MNDAEIPKLHFRYKYMLVIIVVLIVGLVLLILSQNISIDQLTQNGTFWKLLFEHLATAMLVGAFTGGLYEYFLRKEFLNVTEKQTQTICECVSQLGEEAKSRSEKIADFIAANREQRELGVSHCFNEAQQFDFTNIIETPKSLTIVLNDGRTWIGNHYENFVNRFQNDDGKETTFILMHPNSPAIQLHATKVGSTVQGIRIRIAETVNLLKSANSKQKPLRIVGHQLYNTMSVFLGDNDVVLTPYFLAKIRKTPPVFTFVDTGKESFYQKAKQDIESLLRDCTDISSYLSEDGSEMQDKVESHTTAIPTASHF
ncbi:MAG: hypothetical protein AB1724_07560 [Thermodesulfobacteriota bacterium]